jgi:hypothetical protein
MNEITFGQLLTHCDSQEISRLALGLAAESVQSVLVYWRGRKCTRRLCQTGVENLARD